MENNTECGNKYLIFIPVFNEAESIKEIINKVRETCQNSDILVIDDGSTDATPQLLEREKGLYFIKHSENEGYGKTLIDGFNFSVAKGYEYLITIDSDKQHQPEEIKNFTDNLETGEWDIISGSRYLKYNKEKLAEAPEDRRKVNQRITQKINKLTGYNLTDSFCGFKLYKVSSLKKLNLKEHGYGMPLELWIQAWKQSFRIREVPVALIYLDKDTSQTSTYRNVFRRYRYYLKIIEKEINNYEDISISSAS
jgi:dolichol-phosphate mannosyltransferase